MTGYGHGSTFLEKERATDEIWQRFGRLEKKWRYRLNVSNTDEIVVDLRKSGPTHRIEYR